MKLNHTLIALCSWTVLLVLPFDSMGQQPWMQQLQDKQPPSFHQVQQAFEHYWQGKIPAGKGQIPRGQGYKQFKRWEWFWQPRVGPQGLFPRPSVVMEEWEQYRATHPGVKKPAKAAAPQAAPAASTSGNWVGLGPSSSLGGYSGVGRLSHIAFHPTDPNTFWLGSPSGGLWKTTTAGTTWTTLTDHLPVLGVSAIAIDAANPDILYIATGDDNAAATYSVGVLKSTDGGISWNATGLSYHASQTQLIKDLIIHPTNPLILLAATTGGIYRSTNGATSWTKEREGSFQDMVFKPGSPATVYASGNGQIYKSTDTGDTWAQVTAFDHYGRISLAVTPANPDRVGALTAAGDFYTSADSGDSFDLQHATADGLNLLGYTPQGYDGANQGWYDLCLAFSPANDSVVYTGGINIWKSTDAGSNWKISTMWYANPGIPEVHADQHYMAFSPLDPGTLYVCNDGGIYKSTDGGASWTDLSNGLQITQFYRMGNSATNAGLTIAGAQDNGTKIRREATYTDVIGGDGMEAIIDYTNADIMYGTLYYGQILKSTDGGLNFSSISGSLPAGAWITPYVLDPVNPRVLYAGVGHNVYKTTDGGASWAPISAGLSPYELQSLAVAPGNTRVIYTASYYTLYRTITGGGSWSSLPLPATQALTSIEVHPTNAQIFWITFSGYEQGRKVFRTDDGGASWTNISGTLPNLPVSTIEYDKNTGVLYLGNDLGVFVRPPGMADWQVFDTGLPNVVVTELEIQYSSGRLRAATYGRGLWESGLYPADIITYCVPAYRTGCAQGDYIDQVGFHTLVNNDSGCSNATATGYTNYDPDSTLTTTVHRGQSYRLQLQAGPGKAQSFGVWIDFNADKDFEDPGELVYASPAIATSLFTATVTIPATASLGPTRMRVRSSRYGPFTGTEFCSALPYGEAEDYTITIAAPPPGSVLWNYRFGGSGSDYLTTEIKTSDGGYLLGGYAASGSNGDKSEAGRGKQDYWIVKLNSEGAKQWDKRFGGTGNDYLNALIQTSDGGFLLGGSSDSGAGGDKTQTGRGRTDYWIVKVDGEGAKQWDRRYGGAGSEDVRALIELATGGYVLAGVSSSGKSGDKTQAGRGRNDYWIVKVGSDGTQQWDRRFGGSSDDNLEEAISTPDGGFLLGGSTYSGKSGDKSEPGRGKQDYWIVKVSSQGAKQWDKRYGSTAHDALAGLAGTSDGNYLLAGTSTSGKGGDKTEASRGANDFWILQVSSTGARLWDKRYGGAGTDDLRAAIATADGGYLLGGRSDSGSSGDKTQDSRGGYDYWVVKVGSDGAQQWDKRYGGAAGEDLRALLQTPEGGYLLGGRTDSGSSGDKTQDSRGATDYWIVQIAGTDALAPLADARPGEDSVPTASPSPAADNPPETQESVLTASPNPFTKTIKLQFTLARKQQVSLKVYDEQGLEVAHLFTGEAAAGKPYTCEWHADKQKAGLYLVKLITTGKVTHKRILHVR